WLPAHGVWSPGPAPPFSVLSAPFRGFRPGPAEPPCRSPFRAPGPRSRGDEMNGKGLGTTRQAEPRRLHSNGALTVKEFAGQNPGVTPTTPKSGRGPRPPGRGTAHARVGADRPPPSTSSRRPGKILKNFDPELRGAVDPFMISTRRLKTPE